MKVQGEQMGQWASLPMPRPLRDSLATRAWRRAEHLTPIARICLVIWILAGLFGLYQIVGALRAQVRALPVDEQTRRLTTWSPIYGFAEACVARLLPRTHLLLVDPTGAPVAPAESATAYGQTQDVDTANAAAFVYGVYPRQISLLGHVPPHLGASRGVIDYIALWEQIAYRPPAAQAAARAAEDLLRANPSPREVCAYTDAAGDRGVIFAVSPQSLQALARGGVAVQADSRHSAVIAASPFDSWETYARVLLGLACLWGIGAVLLRLGAGRVVNWRLSGALAFPLGCLLATLELLLFSALGIPWSVTLLVGPWLLVALAAGWRARAHIWHLARCAHGASLQRPGGRLPMDERMALGALLVLSGMVIATAPIQLPYSDGFQMYYFKAGAFFSDRSVLPYYSHALALSFSIPAHPPLVPLSVTWLYLFVGHVDEHSSLLLWPALFLSLLAAFYALARTVVARRIALWGTVALALIGYTVTGSAVRGGFADMPLAVYLFIGCALIWLWATTGRQSLRLLLIAGLFLGAAALTKEEGAVAAAVALAALPLLTRRQTGGMHPRPTSWLAPLLLAGCAFLLMVAPWQILRFRYPVPELLVQPGGRSILALLHGLAAAAAGLGLRAMAYWPAELALIALWAIERWRRGERLLSAGNSRLLYLACVVLVQLVADAVGMATNPTAVSAEVSHTASRLLLQVVPLLFLIAVEVWPQLLVPLVCTVGRTFDEASAAATAAAEVTEGPKRVRIVAPLQHGQQTGPVLLRVTLARLDLRSVPDAEDETNERTEMMRISTSWAGSARREVAAVRRWARSTWSEAVSQTQKCLGTWLAPPSQEARTPGRRRRAVEAAGVAVSIALSVILLLPPILQKDISQRDFVRFYHAALLVRSGASPYDVASVTGANLARALHTGIMPNGYLYPPLFAEALIPATWLPVDIAFHIWIVVLAVALVGALALLSSALLGRTSWRLLAVIVPLALLIRPVRDELNQGNVDAVLLLCLCASLWAYQRSHLRRSALLLALAVAIKPFFGLLLIFYVWKGAYRLCGWAVGFMAALVLLPFIPLGVQGVMDWLTVTSFESGPYFAWIAFNQSPYGVALRLFAPNPLSTPIAVLPWLPHVVMVVCAAVVLLVLARHVTRQSHPAAMRTTVEYVLVLSATFLISPLTEPVHLTNLAAPLLVLGVLGWQGNSLTRLWILGALVAIYMVFTLPQVYGFTTLSTGHPHGAYVLLKSLWLYGLVGLLTAVVYALGRVLPVRAAASPN
jgi:hypothetical protein